MGAKTGMIVYADANVRDALSARPQLKRDETQKLATALFPKDKLSPLEDGDLCNRCPPDDEICIGFEAALAALFGYQLDIDTNLFEPESIPLARYKRARSWKFW